MRSHIVFTTIVAVTLTLFTIVPAFAGPEKPPVCPFMTGCRHP